MKIPNNIKKIIKTVLIMAMAEFETEKKFRKSGADLSDITLKYFSKIEQVISQNYIPKSEVEKTLKEIPQVFVNCSKHNLSDDFSKCKDCHFEEYPEIYNKIIRLIK